MTMPAYGGGISTGVTNASVVSFITTDPLGVGLAAIRTANPGADGPLEAALNLVGEAYQVPASPITPSALLNLINAAEFSSMTTAELAQLQTINSAGSIPIGSSSMQSKLNSLFASYPNSLASIQAAYTQNGSPWSYWFGVGLSASNTILDNARNSGSGGNF